MRKLKHSIGIVFLLGVVYALISYGIFYYKKPSLDQQLQIDNRSVVQSSMQPSQGVAIQSITDDYVCQHDQDQQSLNSLDNFDDQSLLHEFQQSIDKSDVGSINSYSFVTIPAKDCIIDVELLYTLDLLIGGDLDEFVRLVLQSNNNIVSKQACRSCAMYAFFNKIKKHEQLSIEDIEILQPLLANLYRFVQKMQALSGTQLLRPSQFEALEDLNRSQKAINDKKIQARKAATAAALKKLQTISYR